jgi:outer membrane protein OmpA-like peptidoglycan-associated protein
LLDMATSNQDECRELPQNCAAADALGRQLASPEQEFVAQLDELLNLFVELQILEQPRGELAKEALAKNVMSAQPLFVSPAAAANGVTQVFIPDLSIEAVEAVFDKPVEVVPTLEEDSSPSAIEHTLTEADLAALGQLQAILVEPGLSKVRHDMRDLGQKLNQLGYQLNDPDELTRLLLPLASRLLNRKLTDSAVEIAEALTPVVDAMIRDRTQQDRAAMSAALATVIPAAITYQIQNSPQEIAHAIAPELAIAIQEQIRLDREAIATALAPEMGAAIRQQVKLESDAMVDALYPVIGHTIAKYMTEALYSINEQVENALSVKGIQRKIRARVQGVSEAELIFQEALSFEVQAVLLIHKSSGLAIVEAQQANSRLEAEMIAGMLTAIRSFVQEYVVQPGETSEISQIEYGGCEIILEVAGYCYLAVIARGEPPRAYIQKIRHTLSRLIQTYSKPIELFSGDPTTIPQPVQLLVTGLVDVPKSEREAKPPTTLLAIGLALLTAIFLPLGIHQYRSSVSHRVESAVISALGANPELAVYRLNVEAKGKTLKLMGRLPNQRLRQQAEQLAKATEPTLQIENAIQAVQVPPDPVLTAAEVKRVTGILNQTAGVSVSSRYLAGEVTVRGTLLQPDGAEKITQAFRQVPGVQSIVTTVQLESPAIATRIYFELNSAAINQRDRATKLVQIKQFLDRYPTLKLRIMGHSDASGNTIRNQQLSLQRARAVQRALTAEGVDVKRLQAVGAAESTTQTIPNRPSWLSRYVEFEAIVP